MKDRGCPRRPGSRDLDRDGALTLRRQRPGDETPPPVTTICCCAMATARRPLPTACRRASIVHRRSLAASLDHARKGWILARGTTRVKPCGRTPTDRLQRPPGSARGERLCRLTPCRRRTVRRPTTTPSSQADCSCCSWRREPTGTRHYPSPARADRRQGVATRPVSLQTGPREPTRLKCPAHRAACPRAPACPFGFDDRLSCGIISRLLPIARAASVSPREEIR